MVKSKRIIMVASLVIALCFTVVAGATFALFSGDTTINTHLVAGSLDIGLVRENGSKTTLDPTTGYLKKTELSRVDFSGETASTVFGVEDGELAAPGSVFEANLGLTNKGSVAFSYKVFIELKDENASELAKQLKVYFKAEGESEYTDLGFLSALESSEDKRLVLIQNAEMAKNAPATAFSVKVEFVNLGNVKNNAAMGTVVNFDLIVEAAQLTSVR